MLMNKLNLFYYFYIYYYLIVIFIVMICFLNNIFLYDVVIEPDEKIK